MSNLLGEFPVFAQGQNVGSVTVSQEGLMTVFDCACSHNSRDILRLAAVSGGRFVPLGVVAPESGLLRLHRRFTRNALASLGYKDAESFHLIRAGDAPGTGTAGSAPAASPGSPERAESAAAAEEPIVYVDWPDPIYIYEEYQTEAGSEDVPAGQDETQPPELYAAAPAPEVPAAQVEPPPVQSDGNFTAGEPAPAVELAQEPEPAPAFELPQEPEPAPAFELPQEPEPAPAFELPQEPEPAPAFELPQESEPAPVQEQPPAAQPSTGSELPFNLGNLEDLKAKFGPLIEQYLKPAETSENVPPAPEEPPVAEGWTRVSHPGVLFNDTGVAAACEGVTGALLTSREGVELLAVPVSQEEPFPMMAVFCFGSPGEIGGREYIIFKIRDGSLTL